MSRVSVRIVMVVILACAGVLGSACTGKFGTVACDSQLQWPHESNGTPGMIDGKATVICRGESRKDLASVTATIKLQKKVGGAWKTVPASVNKRTVTTGKLFKKFTIMTGGIRCARGTYRTGATITGKFKSGGLITSDGYHYSKAVKNPCG